MSIGDGAIVNPIQAPDPGERKGEGLLTEPNLLDGRPEPF
jgi:hypothetical protein